MYMYVHVHAVPTEARGGIASLGAGTISGCEGPGIGAGNWIWVLCKGRSQSEWLSCVSNTTVHQFLLFLLLLFLFQQ